MRKKEQEKILNDLNDFTKKTLLRGFKNRKNKVVDTVEGIQVYNYEIIHDEDDRNHVLVSNIQIGARVFVVLDENAKSSDNILLKNGKPFSFRYNSDIDNYEVDVDTVNFYDAS